MLIPDSEYSLILKKMPVLCVDVLIIHAGKCLLIKRENDPAKGQYWLPGGRVHKLESIENAAIRKAKEETNLNCQYIGIVSVEETIFKKEGQMITDVHTVNICCELHVPDTILLETDKYHSDFKWVDKQSSAYHDAINHPLSLVGFEEFE